MSELIPYCNFHIVSPLWIIIFDFFLGKPFLRKKVSPNPFQKPFWAGGWILSV